MPKLWVHLTLKNLPIADNYFITDMLKVAKKWNAGICPSNIFKVSVTWSNMTSVFGSHVFTGQVPLCTDKNMLVKD